jgi:DNA-binding transcriptional ArsR family regulator
MERRLPARLRTSLVSVAPTPLIWPLLADAFRELPPNADIAEMLAALETMDERTFQTFVLGGVFKTPGAVDALVSGKTSLSRTVKVAAKTHEKLLSVLGLHPFSTGNPGAATFERIVSEPAAYRDEVRAVLESFWASGFAETWQKLEPTLRERCTDLRRSSSRSSFPEFALEHKLPITIEGDEIVTTRSGDRTPVRTANIYLLPSAFNTAKLWAAYADARGRMRFFLPILDASMSPGATSPIEPALVFRALGDTTRYAIASTIARTPMTSVELARAFGVSKPTISHHMQIMRSAGLLDETQTENGVVLALNRRVVERASSAAVRELFIDSDAPPVVKRTRRPT